MLPIIRTLLLTHRRNGIPKQFLGIGILRGVIAIVATTISLNEGTKVINDIRITGIETAGVISVIFFAATMREKNRHNHTLHLLLTHYPHIGRIYIAQIIANIGLSGILYIIMSIIAIGSIVLSGHGIVDGFMWAICLSFVKIICLTTIAQLLGSLVSGYLSSILTLMIYFIGHSTGFVLYYLQRQGKPIMTHIGEVLYYTLPNFQSLDSHAILHQTIGSVDITIGISIMIAYSLIMIGVGIYNVRHQEI